MLTGCSLAGQIARAVYRAAATAAVRSLERRQVSTEDLMAAGQHEKTKAVGDISDMSKLWFT